MKRTYNILKAIKKEKPAPLVISEKAMLKSDAVKIEVKVAA